MLGWVGSGLGEVLGWWVGGILGYVGSVGCLWWGRSLGSLYVPMSHARGVLPPLGEGVFFSFWFIHLAFVVLAFCLKKEKKKESNSTSR